MSRFSCFAIAVVAALLPPAAAGGQIQSDAISRDVVMMILRNHEAYREPDVRVGGALPPELAALVPLPPGAQVVAVLSDRTTSILGTAPMSPDSIRAWFAAEFERRGYLPPESSMERPPFRPAERSGAASGYCSGTNHLAVAARPNGVGPAEFVIRIGRAMGCARPARRAEVMQGSMSSSGSNPPSLPLLYHPRTAEMAARCEIAARAGSTVSADTVIATSSTAQQLFAHYAGQLESGGWARDPFAGAVGSWTMRDSTGRTVRLHLSVEAPSGGSDCRRLRLDATEIER